MRAVILAGGEGTRLAPYTKILPKPLMPIGDMPILEILLRQIKKAGIDDVTITVGYLAQLLRAFFQDGRRLGLNIHYSFEEKPLGTAGPLSLLPPPTDTFLVLNGDVLTTMDLCALVAYHQHSGAAATIASHARRERIDLGVIDIDTTNRITGYREKPVYEMLVSMGVYVFEPHVLSYIEYDRRLDLPDLILRLVDAGELVMSYPYDGYWMDLGRLSDYEQAVSDFESIRDQVVGTSSILAPGLEEDYEHLLVGNGQPNGNSTNGTTSPALRPRLRYRGRKGRSRGRS